MYEINDKKTEHSLLDIATGWRLANCIAYLQNVEEFNSGIHVVSHYTLTNRPDCLLQSAENGFYSAEKDDYQG